MNSTQILLTIYGVSVCIGLLAMLRDYVVIGVFKVKDISSLLICITPCINTIFSVMLLYFIMKDFGEYLNIKGDKVLFSRNKK